jgi:glutamate racemase
MKIKAFDNRAIGVFDSGVGGLTVAAAIRSLLPEERIVYVGDLLHLPYGSKSVKAVLDFTRAAVHFLQQLDVKSLVIACNTATSVAMRQVKNEYDIPLVGVISPGAMAACSQSINKRIGVIGTARTVESGAYREALTRVNPDVIVFQKATPLLVPLIEEGWIGHSVLEMVLVEYLQYFKDKSIDTIVLGCTHYPLIKRDIQKVLEGVHIVDSAETTAESVKRMLMSTGRAAKRGANGDYQIYLTDYTENFCCVGEKIIGKDTLNIQVISLNYTRGKIAYDRIG